MSPEKPILSEQTEAVSNRQLQMIGGRPVMWCACGCGKRVWPRMFSKPEGANGTNVYFVDQQHYELRQLRAALS